MIERIKRNYEADIEMLQKQIPYGSKPTTMLKIYVWFGAFIRTITDGK
jgi:hypothetical protein